MPLSGRTLAASFGSPELADPVGSVEVGEHEDVEQLGTGSRPESVEAFPEAAFELVGTHGRSLACGSTSVKALIPC
jgi:hypothetical protein